MQQLERGALEKRLSLGCLGGLRAAPSEHPSLGGSAGGHLAPLPVEGSSMALKTGWTKKRIF